MATKGKKRSMVNKFAMKNGYLNFSNLNDLNGDKRVSIYQC